jgi:hypothetical protein
MGWKFWRKPPPKPVAAPDAPPALTGEDYQKLHLIMQLVTPDSKPNINGLGEIVRDIRILALNVKSLGYELARQLADALPPPGGTVARHVGLQSKMSTQADIQSDWVSHWCGELKIPVLFHRKLWELGYVLQAMYENGHMRSGARGLGFGAGSEPIASYLASLGVGSTVTDLPVEDAAAAGWVDTGQHASLEAAYHPNLVTREAFDQLVDFRFVDMNAIPQDLRGYDFCWSVCAFEHLGSIAQGLAFVENALATLRPGGMAVHTTEFNIENDGPTVDNWPSVMFQQQHMEALAERLRAQGHQVAPFNFDPGSGVLDRFIDLPPWSHDNPPKLAAWLGHPRHLKVGADGFIATCFGLVITKAA